jgi:hypothetical protein
MTDVAFIGVGETFERLPKISGGGAHSAGHRKGLLAVDGDTDWRMRLPDRLGGDGDASDTEGTGVAGDPIAGPGLPDDLEPLNNAIAILGNRITEGAKVVRHGVAADTELDAAVADDLEGRDLLGDSHRMRQRQQYYRDAEAGKVRVRSARAVSIRSGAGIIERSGLKCCSTGHTESKPKVSACAA